MAKIYIYIYICVCVRERERERENVFQVQLLFTHKFCISAAEAFEAASLQGGISCIGCMVCVCVYMHIFPLARAFLRQACKILKHMQNFSRKLLEMSYFMCQIRLK